jgi:ABC-type glycerol-3-phosphate transport system permease component
MTTFVSSRLANLAGRISAALLGGYALAFGFTAFFSVYLPMSRPDRVVTASLLCFAVWVAAVIYAFAAKSALHAWLLIAGLTALFCLGAYLPVEWRSRP